jgi:hypothetical protein
LEKSMPVFAPEHPFKHHLPHPSFVVQAQTRAYFFPSLHKTPMPPFSLVVSLLIVAASALDNGFRLPPLGWSTWYGYTSNIDESLITGMADAMADKLLFAGYKHIWIDDGFALPRNNITNRIVVDPALFPSGFANLSDYIHSKGLLFGIYTSGKQFRV